MDSRSERVSAAHPLIGELVARRALPTMRAIIDFRVAEIFQTDAGLSGSPALWWEAGIRWRDAGESDRAIRAFIECARHATEIGRPSDAAHILDAALDLSASDEAMIAAARELIIAADRSGEPNLVLRAQHVLHCAGVPSKHDEFELASRRAFCIATRIPEELLELTRRCLCATDATPEHRVSAAIVGLKGADLAGNGDKVAEMIEEVMPHSALNGVTEVVRLEFELLLKSSQDDRDGAADAASRLLTSLHSASPANRISLQLNCGVALFLAGRAQAAIDAFERGFEAAKMAGSISQQLRAAAMLAGTHADLYNDEEWDAWLAKALESARRAPDAAYELDLVVMQLCRSFVAGELVAAEALLSRANHQELFSNGETRERWGRVFELSLRLGKAEVSASDIALARSIFREGLRTVSGVREHEIGIAAAILATRDRQEARASVQHYLEHERYSRKPLDRTLSETIRQLHSDEGEAAQTSAIGPDQSNLVDPGPTTAV